MMNIILTLFLAIGFNAFSQEYLVDDWGSFDFSSPEKIEANKYYQAVGKTINGGELVSGERALLVKLVYSYIEDPTQDKEKILKTLLKFEDRLKASPLSGIQDGIVDHMRRITESLGIIDDFAGPVLDIFSSLESGVTDVLKEGLSALSTDNIKPQDLANIREVAFKIFLYKMDEHSRASVGTAITVSGSNKQYLLDYMFSLDLLWLTGVILLVKDIET